jgi:transcriptional regulator with XRE-family HTH domain
VKQKTFHKEILKSAQDCFAVISRVENGHTVPALETLEKMARALEVPIYQFFYDGEEPPQLSNLLKRNPLDEGAWGSSGKGARFLSQLRRLLGKSDEETENYCCK